MAATREEGGGEGGRGGVGVLVRGWGAAGEMPVCGWAGDYVCAGLRRAALSSGHLFIDKTGEAMRGSRVPKIPKVWTEARTDMQ